jgi:hypothetical protein
MNSTTLFSLGMAGVLFAAEASSEEFTILEGQSTEAASGEDQALTGRLEIRRAEEALSDGSDVYTIDDFELETDAETFLPSLSIEYNGQTALLLQIANQIRDSGDRAPEPREPLRAAASQSDRSDTLAPSESGACSSYPPRQRDPHTRAEASLAPDDLSSRRVMA